jgi:DNA-binding SARP family transcriptional activator
VTVQNYVLRLRRALGDAGHCRIVTQPGGYLIRAGAQELDITRFEALQGQARQRPAQPGSRVRRVSCRNFHAEAASSPGTGDS